MKPVVRSIAVAMALAVLAAGAAVAQPSAAPFPAGKQMTMYVSTGPGGTNDLVGRLVAKHLGRLLPGTPAIVPMNMPGAGGRVLADHMYLKAPRDGTSLAINQRGIVVDPILVDANLRFKIEEMTWIGTPTGTTDLCVAWHTSKVQKLADLLREELVVGSAGTGTETSHAMVLQRLSRGKVRHVVGYVAGGNELNLAMERGEIDGRCGLSWEAMKSNYPDLITKKLVRPLLQYSYQRHADLPDVPLVSEVAQSDLDKRAMDIILLPNAFGFPIYAPPGLLPETRDMLRKAYADLMKDRAFMADAQQIKLDLAPTIGDELQTIIQKAYASPPEVVERAKQLIKTD